MTEEEATLRLNESPLKKFQESLIKLANITIVNRPNELDYSKIIQ